ncbi:hypothetical protein CO057_00090 [Candidatus Uhrbacteria bacterium CG_4_9_14_0_2_um_filter_41_50]|uniref:Uncharacterized protein n=1 Tax=Candidatus Uhrbacteria bacterium CG_4_9_14_0_2_um_filter_41_50 TaxID=1975031 RepID=A0A2M8EQD8_9BACT|nr:MAG: hypothetical protein COZ45_01530 [Candidatus Uhrbacteria bacterium CG_4_10_14_3_um_filter_41_21]PJC24959.1 MAG: hypothetical protein CO057_00090 [Candidatus Uhrbacteria bacterium CG_4_9_14_0_2_um_filter_41_50]
MAYNVADMRSFAHSLFKFNNCVRNLGERRATSEPHIVLLCAPSRHVSAARAQCGRAEHSEAKECSLVIPIAFLTFTASIKTDLIPFGGGARGKSKG